MAVRTVAVHLTARVDAYVAAMRAASASTLGFSRTTERNLTQVGTSMQRVGRQMTTFITAPLLLMGAGAVKAAVDWESAWAGVTKTVNGTATEMETLEQGLRDLTDVLPATHGEIAAVAEAAGALGIAQEDILGFTKVMIDLGETTNLTADQAATSIAQLMNIMQTAPGDVDNLASALVHLGNTGASTEDEILEMAHRIAGAGQLIGLSEAEVLGFAAAMADLGIKSEQGGTAIQRVFLKMHTAVLSGSADLTEFGRIAGMTGQDFAAMWEDDPARAVAMFIEGLGRLDAAGGDAGSALRSVGINGQLAQQVLFRMMGDVGGLTDALDRSNSSWEENVALIQEANKRYDTSAARFEMVRNKIVDLFIDLGNLMLPTIEKIVEVVGFLAESFQALPAPLQVAVGGFLAVVAAIGPILFIGGSLIKNLTSITSLFGLAAGAANPYIAALVGIGAAITAGVALYGMFTAGQREVAARTREVGDALIGATDEAWDYATAAAGASGEIDGFTIAQRALSLALTSTGEDGEKLTQALGAMGQQAENALPILMSLAQDPVEAMASLAEQAGITGDAAQLLANGVANMGTDDAERDWRNYLISLTDVERATLDAAGVTTEHAQALRELLDQAKGTELDELATQYFNEAIAADEDAEALIELARARAEANDIADSSVDVYFELMGMLGEMSDEEQAAALDALGLGEATQVAAGDLEDLTEGAVTAADAFTELSATFDTLSRNMATGTSGASVEQWAWIDGLSAALTTVIGVQGDWVDSALALWEASDTFAESIDGNSTSLEYNSEAGRTNIGVLADWSDGIIAHAQNSLAQGHSVAEVTGEFEHNRQAMIDAAIAAGFEEEEVLALLDALGLADADWEAAITISGHEIAMKKIEALLIEMENVDEGVIAEVNTILETEGAWAALDYLIGVINSSSGTVDVYANTSAARQSIADLPGFAEGGIVHDRQVVTVAERGPELILPLNNPTRAATLLGLPEVQAALDQLTPAVYASFGGGGSSGGGSGGGGSSYTTQNVTVVMPPGSNGDDVVRALRKWERHRGPVPITTR